jgi:Zn ribbon nucleic-acid-binding protein
MGGIFDCAPITYGRIYCPICCDTTHFVSWDENRRRDEDAECKECGFQYGYEVVIVEDPVSKVVTEERVPVLDPAILAKAKADMIQEFMLGVQSVHGTRREKEVEHAVQDAANIE